MSSKDTELVEKFVASFTKLTKRTELKTNEILDPVAWQLAEGASDEFGYRVWRPIKQQTAPSHLDAIYSKVPVRFPPLYEKLILAYRWADVDLQLITLLANPPAQDLIGRISAGKHVWNHLIRAGYIPFAKGSDIDYDPVCLS